MVKLHDKLKKALKNRAIVLGGNSMYKSQDRQTPHLFEELFPFGGKLDSKNRWLKIAGLIPLKELEQKYAQYFSDLGRPGTDGRLAVGLFLLKHMSGKSDVEVVLELLENPYWQSFCGLEAFATERTIEASTLSRLRKRLGHKYVKEMEEATYRVLIDKKIMKAKGMLVDGTVIPENIKYPNDVGLLNDVRQWLVKTIKGGGKEIGEKLKTAETIFEQQMKMYRDKSHRAVDRIVSFHRPWVRPIKRGKNGKDVEFGAKASMSHVDGFLFLDKTDHDNFSESQTEVVRVQLENYEKRFGKKPASFTGDQAYGSRENREWIEKGNQIRTSFVQLGKRKTSGNKMTRWFKQKQRERNRIEGHFGHGKEHYRLDKVWYHGREGSETWTRGGILAMNLMTALARI